MSFEIPLGPLNRPLVVDNFSYEDVKQTKCFASVSKNICEALKKEAPSAETRYLCICLPCYNEQFEELLKTFLSLMENIEFMQRKARLHDDESGQHLKRDFINTVPVIVPIFDGTKAISPSIREWLTSNFHGMNMDTQSILQAIVHIYCFVQVLWMVWMVPANLRLQMCVLFLPSGGTIATIRLQEKTTSTRKVRDFTFDVYDVISFIYINRLQCVTYLSPR